MIISWKEEFDILFNLISAIIAIDYMNHCFVSKFERRRAVIFSVIGCACYFGIITVLNKAVFFEGVLGVGYGVILIIYGCLTLNGKIHEKITMGFLWIVIIILNSYIIWHGIRIISGKELSDLLYSNTGVEIYATLAGTTLKFCFSKTITMLYAKVKGNNQNVGEWTIAFAFFFVFLIVIGMYYLELKDDYMQRTKTATYIIGSIIGLLICLGCFYQRMELRNRKIQEAQYNIDRLEKQKDHIKDVARIHQELHLMRHDLVGKVNTINEFLRKGKLDPAISYIQDMAGIINGLAVMSNETGNEGVDAAIVNAIYSCKEKDINFSYFISGKFDVLDAMDIGLLLFNLLNNAIEACEKISVMKEREIYLNINCNKRKCVITLENSIIQPVLQENSSLQTTKKDKSRHGFGLESIKKIVKKYHGSYEVFEEDHEFNQYIVLRLS